MSPSTPQPQARIRRRIAGLKSSRRFVDWREVGALADRLCSILDEIAALSEEPKCALELMVSFLETDVSTLGRCDDSDGVVGDVYVVSAPLRFAALAHECNDRKWLVKLLLRVLEQDEFGVRVHLLDNAKDYLDETNMRALAGSLMEGARAPSACVDDPSDPKATRARRPGSLEPWVLFALEQLASQLNDPVLLETAFRLDQDDLPSYRLVQLAEQWLKVGRAEKALVCLDRIPSEDDFMAERRDQALLAAYSVLGHAHRAQEVAWRIFRRGRSRSTFDQLVMVLGLQTGNQVLEGELITIAEQSGFSVEDLTFMVEMDQLQAAEDYVVARRQELDGRRYDALLHATRRLVEAGLPLGATVCSRALLDSILEASASRIYYIAVRYLSQLERLEPRISDWRDVPTHSEYLAALRQQHHRKHAFWRNVIG